jgi:uncharacterized protein YdhG (YjbR/CyaY superfamily)
MNVDAYLAKLPADRRAALTAIRNTINANVPAGYEEGVQFGMICWFVPLSRYPDTYNKQPLCLAALASQKHHMAMYLMSVYGSPKLETWLAKAYAAAGKKLDMGKSCVRFKQLEDVPLGVIGELIGKVDVETYVKATKAVHAKTATKAKANAKPKAKPRAKPKAKPKQPAANRRKR